MDCAGTGAEGTDQDTEKMKKRFKMRTFRPQDCMWLYEACRFSDSRFMQDFQRKPLLILTETGGFYLPSDLMISVGIKRLRGSVRTGDIILKSRDGSFLGEVKVAA